MTLQELLGESFKDGMTAEDIAKALENVEDSKTEIARLNADVERYKNALSKSNSEAAEYKRKERDRLSEDEKRNLETQETIASLQSQLEEYKKEKEIADLKSRFIGLGYSDEDAKKSAEDFHSGNTESVFASLVNRIANVEKEANARVIGGTPRPNAGQGATPSITKKDFESMSMPERTKLFNENRELYDSLTK